MWKWRGKEVRLLSASIPARKLFDRSASSPSSSKLFVGGLSYDTNEAALKEAFSQHGEIIQVKVICHPTTGMSKGYGFVKFSLESEAALALQEMNGNLLDGRNIRVQYADNG